MSNVQLTLVVLLLLAAWIPAVVGWGILSLPIRSRFSLSNPWDYDITEPIVGLATLSVVANLLNFFVPLSNSISLSVLLLGWLLFLVRARRIVGKQRLPSLAVFAVLWLALLAFAASQAPRVADTDLYHSQSIKWLTESLIPLGLANLHARFGLNSSWLSIAGLLAPRLESRPNVFTVNALLVWFYGLAVYTTAVATLRKEQWLVSDVFLLLTPVAFQGFYLYSFISSPSPDLPIILLTFLSVWIALKAIDGQIDLAYAIWTTLFIATFSITIKMSAAPLGFIPTSLVLFSYAHRQRVAGKPLLTLAICCAVALLLPWLSRGVLLSGCLVYPVKFTCLPFLSWTVSQSQADYVTALIQSWARAPGVALEPTAVTWDRSAFDSVLTNWNWLSPWLRSVASSKDILSIVALLVVGLVLRFWPVNQGRDYARHSAGWVVVPLLIGVGYWFLTAPDRRFGAGYLWSIALLVMSMGLVRFRNLAVPGISAHLRYLLGNTIVMSSIAGGVVMIAGYSVLCAMSQDANASGFLGRFKEIPADQVDSYETLYGNLVYKPRESARCATAPLPCTPYFDPALRISKTRHGRLIMFFPR